MFGGAQFKFAGLNVMFMVLNLSRVALPTNEVAQMRGPSDLVTVSLKVPLFGAVKAIESVMVNAELQVETSMV
jgi:hypothetical protein